MSDLTKKTCKELRNIAKEYSIVGRWDMNKQELIEAIMKVSDLNKNDEPESNIDEEPKTQPEGNQKDVRLTSDYLKNIEAGTLVAFKRNNKEVAMSGKFVSFSNGKVLIESKKGTVFTLTTDKIIWVKTGNRWPKWVFNLFNNPKAETPSTGGDSNVVS